jgi:hypothetical protein
MHRRSIILHNKTHWRDDHLRAFILRGARLIFAPSDHAVIECRVVYTRQHHWCTGVATIGGRCMTIRVPKLQVDKTDLAHVVVHELGHNRGLRHNEMRCGGAKWYRVGNWRERYAWGEELPLEVKPPVVKPSRRPVAEKLEHAQRGLDRWVRKQKLATTKVRAWKRQVRYYEKRLVAATTGGTNAVHDPQST